MPDFFADNKADEVKLRQEEVVSTWRNKIAIHQPTYDSPVELAEVLETIRSQPPIVFAGEVDQMTTLLAKAAQGKAFVLQGGDCAETFATVSAQTIKNKLRTMLQMALVLSYGASVPVVKIGRMAGQYAKPRSCDIEERDGVRLPSYFGDAVNSYEFSEIGRRPDPKRMLQAYNCSATTINLIRAFSYGGFADLRSLRAWNRGFINNRAYTRYEALASEIDRAIRFMQAVGADIDALRSVDFYAAHEALLLPYEEAITRFDKGSGRLYCYSAHFLWAGERTRDVEGAHIEFLSQIANPVGVKLGPNITATDMLRLVDKINPDGVPGKLSFITRMGAQKIVQVLPELLASMQADGRAVTWICDPMHGNTITSTTGYKTRRMEDVLQEVHNFFTIHREIGTVPGGLHVELTGDDVTEVMGGAESIADVDLSQRYETLVDPRLNHQQSLELAFDVAERIAKNSL